ASDPGRSARPNCHPATAPASDNTVVTRKPPQSVAGWSPASTALATRAATGPPRDATASRPQRSRCGPRCASAATAAASSAHKKPEEPYHSTTPSNEDRSEEHTSE